MVIGYRFDWNASVSFVVAIIFDVHHFLPEWIGAGIDSLNEDYPESFIPKATSGLIISVLLIICSSFIPLMTLNVV